MKLTSSGHFCFFSPSVAPRYCTEAESKRKERNIRSILDDGLWKFASVISLVWVVVVFKYCIFRKYLGLTSDVKFWSGLVAASFAY